MRVQLMAAGIAAEAFTPDSISGLQIWLVADDLDATQNDADNLNGVTWASHTPATNDFALSGTAGPVFKTSIINGHDVVRFTGSLNQHGTGGDLSSLFATAATVFMVIQANTDTQYTVYMTRDSDTWTTFSADAYVGPFKQTRTQVASGAAGSTGVHYLTFRSDASAYRYRRDGTTVTTLAADYAAGNNHRLAAGTAAGTGNMTGDIAELLVYDSSLSDQDVLDVEAYLVDKYAL